MALWATFLQKQFLSLHGRQLGLFKDILGPSAQTFPETILGGDGFHGVLWSTSDSLTAAGSTQAGALVLTSMWNRLTTVGASTGVQLAILQPGMGQIIVHDGTSNLTVYPNTGDVSGVTIDGVAAATGVTLTAGRRGWYMCTTAGTIVSGYWLKSA